MNAITPIDAWAAATREVNAWRGEAIHHFARAETEIGTTLVALRARLPDAKIRIDHLAGQRLPVLLRLTEPDGAAADARVIAALDIFSPYLEKRAPLCHGVTRIALERDGDWVVVIEHTHFDKAGTPTELILFTEEQARAWLVGLKKETSRLSAALRTLRG